MLEESRTIGEWIDGMDDEVKVLTSLSQYDQFVEFVTRLLAVSSNEKVWWSKMQSYLRRFSTDNFPDERELGIVLKLHGYRFPKKGAYVIDMAHYVYKTLGESMELYLSVAREPKKIEDGFTVCPFLKIKGVGFKVRDLALTDFTLEYPVVDIHVKRIINRLGLFESKNPVDGVTPVEYREIRKLCLLIAKRLNMKPAQLDRALWHLGRSFCNKTPKCGECPNGEICPKVIK
ncbi:hypothetical protein KJ807_06010 [Patescibacteria group bacterium]|nr:hypothetical protein [Patescibacteria group bacterium]